jgi:hypothetical protein
MARQGARTHSRARPATRPPETEATHAVAAARRTGRGFGPWLVIGAAGFAALPALRWFGIIEWAWALVFAPFTAIGVAITVGVAGFLYRDRLASIRTRIFGARAADATTTPPPDRLEPPAAAVEAGDAILAEHPEILAALCHGFRMKKLMPSVLGKPVTDPWGVYRAALTASAAELGMLRLFAAAHTAHLAKARRKGGGRVSDANAMRTALDAFRPCAEKAEAGRGHPDCPFEHVTVIFGAESSPNRDAHLRSVAPKVRSLLERQYPQLETARLADGSQVKFGDWQRRASQEHAEISRLRKDLERQGRTVEQLRAQVAEAGARADALAEAAVRQRREALEDARIAQERVVSDLRAALDCAGKDHTRDVQRHEAERAKLSAANDALVAERESLELALLTTATGGDDPDPTGQSDLTGVRVLIVGGEPRQIAPLRERLESLGAQLLHDDGVAAAEHVAHVHVVVFWIRYLSHPTYFGVRQRVRALRVRHCYWGRTSPGSLAALVARTVAGGGPPGEPARGGAAADAADAP